MNVRVSWSMCLLVCLSAMVAAADFAERWQTATIGEYVPSDFSFILGDEGYWFLGDTVSAFPECGPTPQRGEIVMHNGSRALRLTCVDTGPECAPNVWVEMTDFISHNPGFSIPITPGTILSFEEEGELIDPFLWSGVACFVPPCGDAVSVAIADDGGHHVIYVLQRHPDAEPFTENPYYGERYIEIYLDPTAGSYSRNVFNDFLKISEFDPVDARLTSISLEAEGTGWAVFDDIMVTDKYPVWASVLQGTWQAHGLISGDSPAQTPGWYWGTLQIDANGNATATSAVHDSLGNSSYVPNLGQFTVTSWGTVVNSQVPSYLGAVTGRGDLIAGVATMAPGGASGVSGYNLQFMVKKGSGYTTQDLAGTWWMHHLNSTGSPSWTGWSRGKLQVNTTGNSSLLAGSYANSDGDSDPPAGGTLSITSGGVLGISLDPDAHGVLNAGRDLAVITMNHEGGEGLRILQKRTGVTFSTADLAGIWNFRGLTSGDVPQVSGWSQGMMTFDSSGSVSAWAANPSGDVAHLNTTASLTSEGIFTFAHNASTHGTMSNDKNLIIYTANSSSGTGIYVLGVLIRQGELQCRVYRFWSPVNKRHFYTTSETEKNKLINNYSYVWTYEGTAYFALPTASDENSRPVYRFWSSSLKAHFYTIKESEKNKLITQFSNVWQYERVAFYAYPAGLEPAATSPVYRFWSSRLKCHFYTISATERDKLINNFSSTWQYEGVAWHAYP